MEKRLIPSTGEALPVVGLGTWQAFDVASDNYHSLKQVLTALHQAGGSVIDSSPMYGRAEQAVGNLTAEMPVKDQFFYATKVWTEGREEGIRQMQASFQKMQRAKMDLIQIHNLVDWKTHLKTLRRWKEEGKVRYIGITHYTDSMHEALEKIVVSEKIDFVQFNYSLAGRSAEKRLLPAAQAQGVATLINRPFGEGKLLRQLSTKPLPPWAAEQGMENWSHFLLKYILAHPAVTCVIPGTGNAQHMKLNASAGAPPFPDEKTKRQMVDYITRL